MDIILLPFRVVRASVSAAFRTTVASSQAARSLFIDWDWLEPAQEAVTDTVSSMAMPTLKLVLLLVLATFSFASSASVYFAFYQFYIPQIHHQFPLYFDFSDASSTVANTPIALTRNQEFDVSIHLELPESDENKAAGMFMVGLQLSDEQNTTLATAKRPCILRYKSTILHWMQTAFYSVPYVLGLFEQRQFFTLELLQAAANPWANPAKQALVTIDDTRVQIYSASLIFHIRLYGLRYLMWHFFWTTALCSTFFLTGCMMTVFGLAYLTLSSGEPEADEHVVVNKQREPFVPVVRREPILEVKKESAMQEAHRVKNQ